MTEQFQNPQQEKVDETTTVHETAQQRIDRVANELAVKPSRTEKKFDDDNSKLFSK